jgi:hypothetical protein
MGGVQEQFGSRWSALTKLSVSDIGYRPLCSHPGVFARGMRLRPISASIHKALNLWVQPKPLLKFVSEITFGLSTSACWQKSWLGEGFFEHRNQKHAHGAIKCRSPWVSMRNGL